MYPFDGVERLVRKDRRGEIFYYMHQQVIARYRAERLSNNMGEINNFSDFRAPIREGYFPKLDTLVANRAWPSRPDGVVLTNLNRAADELRLNIGDMETHRDRFNKAVQDGFAITPNNQRVPLNNDDGSGIEHLGNMMESSILSPNRDFYGNLHNSLHNLISVSSARISLLPFSNANWIFSTLTTQTIVISRASVLSVTRTPQ